MRSADETTASVRYSLIGRSAGLAFEGLAFTDGVEVVGASDHVSFLHNEFSGELGIRANGEQASAGTKVTDVTIEANYIHDLQLHRSPGNRRELRRDRGQRSRTLHDHRQHDQEPGVRLRPVGLAGRLHGDGQHIPRAEPAGQPRSHQDLWQIFGGGRNITFADNVAHYTETQESAALPGGSLLERSGRKQPLRPRLAWLYLPDLPVGRARLPPQHGRRQSLGLPLPRPRLERAGQRLPRSTTTSSSEPPKAPTSRPRVARRAGEPTITTSPATDRRADRIRSATGRRPWQDMVNYLPTGQPLRAGRRIPTVNRPWRSLLLTPLTGGDGAEWPRAVDERRAGRQPFQRPRPRGDRGLHADGGPERRPGGGDLRRARRGNDVPRGRHPRGPLTGPRREGATRHRALALRRAGDRQGDRNRRKLRPALRPGSRSMAGSASDRPATGSSSSPTTSPAHSASTCSATTGSASGSSGC